MDFPLSKDITKVVRNFEVLSDHQQLETEDLPMSAALKSADNWKDGMWVKTGGSTVRELVATDGTAVRNSYCIYTGSESASDHTYDTYATGKLTVIKSSGWFGRSKSFSGTPVSGDLLVVKSGVLVAATTDAEKLVAVAVCDGPIIDGYVYFRAL